MGSSEEAGYCPAQTGAAGICTIRPSGFLVAGERPCIRLRDGRTFGPLQRDQPPIQAAPKASRAAADKVSRSTTHVRNPAIVVKRQPQDRLRNVGPRYCSYHPRYLQPRAP